MKTPPLIICLFGFMAISFSGQQSPCFKLTEGQSYTADTQAWVNALMLDPKFSKMKQEQRDKKVEEFNDAINKGRKGDYGAPSEIKVTKIEQLDDMTAIHLKAMAYEYETVIYCDADTMYLVRFPKPIWYVYQGDTLGVTFYGVQKMPTKLQVGDMVPSYTDFTMMTPKTWTTEMKEKVLSYSYYSTEYESFGFGQDNSGNYGWGPVQKRVKNDVYTSVSHELQVTEQVQNTTINNAIAYVTETEEMKLGGTTVTAYIIESQQWTKQDKITDFYAEKQSIANQAKKDHEKLQDKIKKKMLKVFPENELGYQVVYKKEWYVPGFGIVKSISHDAHGAIQSKTTVTY